MSDAKTTTIGSYDSSVAAYQQQTQAQPKPLADFIALLPLGGTVLDLGCGWGRDSAFLAKQGFRVTGVDLSPKMIKQARGAYPRIDFQIQDFEQLKLPPSSFDGVWFHAALLHCPRAKWGNVLTSVGQLLKPGGVLFVSLKEGAGEALSLDQRYDPPIQKFWSYAQAPEVEALLIRLGFELVQCEREAVNNAYQSHPWLNFLVLKN